MKLRLFVFRCTVLAIALALLSRDGNAQLSLPSLSPLLERMTSLVRVVWGSERDPDTTAWRDIDGGDASATTASSVLGD